MIHDITKDFQLTSNEREKFEINFQFEMTEILEQLYETEDINYPTICTTRDDLNNSTNKTFKNKEKQNSQHLQRFRSVRGNQKSSAIISVFLCKLSDTFRKL